MSQARPWPRPTCFPTLSLSSIGAPHLVQVVGDVDHTEVPSMIDDMGYLLDDTGLPMNNGQVQRPGDWGSRLWFSKPRQVEHPLLSKPHSLHNLPCWSLLSPDLAKGNAAPELNPS